MAQAPTGFLQWERQDADERPVEERRGDWKEYVLPWGEEAARKQAGRCMDCGVPFCHQGCPLGNVIPDFNQAVARGDWKAAHTVLASTNNFPEFTGRLCPAPCEAACVLAIDQDAVAIEHLEKEISERAFAQGWVKPRPPSHRTGRRVAVVGSGPAGLAAAAQLNAAGHAVTVYEKDEVPGGLLRLGIPDFKMEKWVVERRLEVLRAEGITFACGVEVGRAPRWDALRADFDAVVIAVGAQWARALDVPGAELSGVVQAMDFLAAQNRAVAAGGAPDAALSARGKRVVILGGGDTGSDCLGTCHRQGALEVAQVELFPAPPPTRTPGNPWPRWPVVFRTSGSQEEGGARLFARRTTRLEGQDGTLTALHWVTCRVTAEGRLEDVPGTEERYPVDLLIQAMGFVGPQVDVLQAQLGVTVDEKGRVKRGPSYETDVPGVFCAGDAGRGASLIVWAIAEGRELARAVDAWLMRRPSALPARGQDAAFR